MSTNIDANISIRDRIVLIRAHHSDGATVYGSGFVVAGRTVLTAAHVVHGAVSVEVQDAAKNWRHPATLEADFIGDPTSAGGRDRAPDLALIRIEPPNANFPQFRAIALA